MADPEQIIAAMSARAKAALVAHTRDDNEGWLFGNVLGEAEQLWFESQLFVANGGEPLVERQTSVGMHFASYSYRPTTLGHQVRNLLIEGK